MTTRDARRPLGGSGWLLFATLSLAPLDAAARPEPPPAERWFVLDLAGQPAGWAVERWWDDDGRRVTEAELKLRMARGTATLEVALAGRFEETEDGEPLLLRTRQELGSSPIETTYRFTPAGVVAESVHAGRRRRERLALPEGEWLTPGAARRAVAAHHAAGDREYRVRSLDPLEGLEPVTVRRTWLGEGAVPGASGRWREESSSAPGTVSTAELDASGEVVWSATELFGVTVTLRRVGREIALAVASGGSASDPAAAAPQVLTQTLVRPDRPIADSKAVHQGVYELSLAGGVLPEVPAGTAQRVERRGGRVRVTVTARPQTTEPPPAERSDADPTSGPTAGADPGRPTVAPSLYLDHEDPAVGRLLAAALPPGAAAAPSPPGGPAAHPGAPEAADVARALTGYVHRYVDAKGLDTGFATASEVARSRRGDCTEHAVLLAALLRGAGIPSRVVTGLVYLDEFAGAHGVFGYHMWVQAFVEGVWLDLDPTLPWGFDATHIALALSDLSGPDAGAALDRMLPLVGRLRIEVVELVR